MLRVSKVPPGDPTTEEYVGQNRFECLTCPYHFVINKRYYERKYMKKKEVEDILGGKGAWDNVDKTQGMFLLETVATVWRTRRRQMDRNEVDVRTGPRGCGLTTKQYNVRTRSAGMTKHIGISCRFEALMSL